MTTLCRGLNNDTRNVILISVMKILSASSHTVNKYQLAQTIRILMDYGGIDWEELQELAKAKTDAPAPVLDNAIDPWERARGLLKDHPIDPLAYQEQVRSEWDNYP